MSVAENRRDMHDGRDFDRKGLSRRSFIATAAAGLAAAAITGSARAASTERRPASPLIRPAVLHRGDTVGLIAPAKFVVNPDSILRAEKAVRYFGLLPRFGRSVRARTGFVGGSVEQRVADIHEMFLDPEVKAVFCLRGGSGSMQLLDRIDYALLRGHPKIFMGFSDITALHLAIHRHAGLITFHGPVTLSRFSDYTQHHFRKALFDAAPIGVVTNPPDDHPIRPSHSLRTVRPGTARGLLTGGNLSIISATMGTRYEIDTTGRILFLEDVDEQPYKLERMLTQLRLAGKLERAAGIIIGECTNRKVDLAPFDTTVSVGEVIDDVCATLAVPVLSGLTIGHTADQLTLPLGVTATLDADKGTLTIEEPALSAK